jgi:hypothetical protein
MRFMIVLDTDFIHPDQDFDKREMADGEIFPYSKAGFGSGAGG